MSSQVSICNLALVRLGAPTITSIDDDTKSAKLCKKAYDMVVEKVISEGPWTRATKRAELSLTGDDPVFGYAYEFQLPTDCLDVLSINDIIPGEYDYRIEEDKLLIDASAVSIKYIALLSTPGSFGIHITKSVVDLLTAEIAFALTGNLGLVQGLHQLYLQNLHTNLALDGIQGSKDIVSVSTLTEVR